MCNKISSFSIQLEPPAYQEPSYSDPPAYSEQPWSSFLVIHFPFKYNLQAWRCVNNRKWWEIIWNVFKLLLTMFFYDNIECVCKIQC